jgi:ribosomal protein S3
MEYFDSRDDLKVGSTSDYRCVVIQPQNVRNLQPGVIGIDVWVMLGDLNATAETYVFRWDGTRWIGSTPEETGVTVTTSVS